MAYSWRRSWQPGGREWTWPSLTEVARTWWSEEPNPHSDHDEDYPAHEFVDAHLQSGADDCVDLLQALVDQARDDEALASLGAGPVEDLLSHFGHGARFLDQVETRCRHDAGWRKAVAGVWLGGDVPAEVRRRLAPFGATDLSGEYQAEASDE